MKVAPIDSDPDKLGGQTCIAGTRIPVDYLFIHLAQGGTIYTFIDEYEWLKAGQLKALLQFAGDDMVNDRGVVERARARVSAGVAHAPTHCVMEAVPT